MKDLLGIKNKLDDYHVISVNIIPEQSEEMGN